MSVERAAGGTVPPPMAVDAALELIRQGRHDAAIDALAAIAESGGDSRVAALGHRAWHLNSIGRYEEAIADWDKVLAHTPTDTETAALRAEALVKIGQPREAAEVAAELLGKDPLNSRAYAAIGRSREALGLDAAPHSPKANTPAFSPAMQPRNRAIEALENADSGFAGSVHPEVGRFLYGIVRMLRPKTVVETGTWIAYSALCICQALEDNGGGHLHSFDVFGERDGWQSAITGPCRDSLAMARAHMEFGGLAHRVTFHQGDSSTRIRDRFARKPDSVDLAFLDGDHRIPGIMRDWEAVGEVLAPGGLVLLHDTDPDACGWYGPRYVIEKLQQGAAPGWRALHVPTADRAGMGILQKATETSPKMWSAPISELIRDRLHHPSRTRAARNSKQGTS